MQIRTDTQLSAEDLARIDKLKETPWIGYDTAVSLRQQMDALIRHPRIHRMPNLALIGDSNNGKTTILQNFYKKHYPEDNLNAERITKPVLIVQTPPTANEGRLYYEILDQLSAAGSPNEPDSSKLHRIHVIFKHLDLKVLILDDFFNIASGSPAQRRKFLNAIRNLGIECQISMILSGTSETLNILSIDPSISNRFKPIFLPRWKSERAQEFAQFVISLENSLLLKQKCEFYNEKMFNQLLFFSEGLTGEVVALLHLLAETAIRTGKEKIEVADITAQNLKRINWVIPSDRSRHPGD